MLSRVFDFFYKRIYPVEYARKIGVIVGDDCRLINTSYSTEPYLITLGNRVSATKVHFETHDGGVWVLRDELPNIDRVKKITVGSNVFIGYESLILPGVTIGDNVIIGARSVVSKSIPSNCVAVGSPAEPIKNISEYKIQAIRDGENTKQMSFEEKKQYYTRLFSE